MLFIAQNRYSKYRKIASIIGALLIKKLGFLVRLNTRRASKRDVVQLYSLAFQMFDNNFIYHVFTVNAEKKQQEMQDHFRASKKGGKKQKIEGNHVFFLAHANIHINAILLFSPVFWKYKNDPTFFSPFLEIFLVTCFLHLFMHLNCLKCVAYYQDRLLIKK